MWLTPACNLTRCGRRLLSQLPTVTVGLTSIDSFAQPTWGYWVRDILRPEFPVWVEELAKVHSAQFTSADAMWSLLHKHEPMPVSVSSLLALHDGPQSDRAHVGALPRAAVRRGGTGSTPLSVAYNDSPPLSRSLSPCRRPRDL